MTYNPHAKWTPPPTAPPEPEPKKPRRWFLWTFLAVQVLFILWILTGVDATREAGENCQGLDAQTCHDAATAGAAIGLGIVLAVWAAVDIILGVTYAIVRLNRRPRR